MRPREEQPEPRRPHTFYLTDQLWEELERRYLQERLAGTTETKIGFVEEVLRAGLASSRGATGAQPGETTASKQRGTSARRDVGKAAAPTHHRAPGTLPPVAPAPAGAEVDDSDAPAAGARKAAPARPSRTARSGALARLRDASDPGRPPPINSAASVQPSADHADEGLVGS